MGLWLVRDLSLSSVFLPIQGDSSCLTDYFLVSGISSLNCANLNKIFKESQLYSRPQQGLCEHANHENHFYLGQAELPKMNTIIFR